MNDLLLQHLKVLVHQLCFGEQLDMGITYLWFQYESELQQKEHILRIDWV